MMEISIIIPVYNGSRDIDIFIEGVKENTLNSSKYEIIFVDNGSTDNSRERLKQLKKDLMNYNIEVLECLEKKSSYAARNIGAEKASGKTLAFVDIDCRLDKKYLENALKVVESGRGYAGHVVIESEDSNVWEIFDTVVHMNNKENARKNRIVTANMCISKSTFEKIGRFDEVYSGGDYLYGKRMKASKVEIVYSPEIKVAHPSRKTYEEIRSKLLRVSYGEGQIEAIRKKSPIIGVAKQILRILNLPKHLRVSREIRRRRCSGVVEFNIKYFYLKVKQTVAFIEGYKSIRN